jgi:hypothetical protein
MSLRPKNPASILPRTSKAAWASSCPKGTPAMLIRDRSGELFADADVAELYPADGRPGAVPSTVGLGEHPSVRREPLATAQQLTR